MLDIENIRLLEKNCRIELNKHVRNLMIEPRSQSNKLYLKNEEDTYLILELAKQLRSVYGLELAEQLNNMIERLKDNVFEKSETVNFKFSIDESEPEFIFWCDNLCGVRFTDLTMNEAILTFEIFSLLEQFDK